MSDEHSVLVAQAIRDAVHDVDEVSSSELLEVLLRSAEHVLFDAAALAPARTMVFRALDRLDGVESLDDLTEAQLLERWDAELRAQILAFTNRPRTWTEPASERFLDDCSSVFGVDERYVEPLLQRFHGLPDGQRYGIFLVIEKSAPFSYLTREIDGDSGGRPVEHPARSFRALLRQVFAGCE